ncbi:MAG: FtsW/RodA/SpoVE family cell cycle protein [Prevotellaceae bacterium]|jgi:cell division protein FtsW|nr:FtsW/RodA/SpoVE family cell cycle protein [Prevotellaceae bacterium]
MQNIIRKYFKGDLKMWVIIGFLCLIAVLAIYSASAYFVRKADYHAEELVRHGKFLVTGIILAWGIHLIPFRWVRVFGYILLPVSIIFMLIIIFKIDLQYIKAFTEKGATRQILFFGQKIQVFEFVKLSMIIILADLMSAVPEKSILLNAVARWMRKDLSDNLARKLKFWLSLAIFSMFAIPVALENGSTGILLFAVGFSMLLLSNLSLGRWLIMLAAGILLIGGMMLFGNIGRSATWDSRVGIWLSDDIYAYNEKTAQTADAQIAIAKGGWLGVGPGMSSQRDRLSQAYDDAIFGIIVEEFGFIGALFVMFLYLSFLYRAGILAKKCPRQYPALLVLGLALMIVLQAFFHMGTTTLACPPTGQPLPLISRGGMSVLFVFIYIGIIQSVARNVDEMNAKKAESGELKTEREELEIKNEELENGNINNR